MRISTQRAGVGLQCVYAVGPAYGSQNADERVVHSSMEPLLCVCLICARVTMLGFEPLSAPVLSEGANAFSTLGIDAFT
mgnify:CR=1 FL=1